MAIKVGINGFGRIGRNFYRAALQRDLPIEVVAVNDLGSPGSMASLLKNDSIHGRLAMDVSANDDGIQVGEHQIRLLGERDPSQIPWKQLGVDLVVEATGRFTDKDSAAAHLGAGAKLVIVSSPSAGADATFVYGINHHEFDVTKHKVISNASCTTNCFVPMVHVLEEAFSVESGMMTTIHSYTADQVLVDGPHSDQRRARAAALNIVPTSTGAAKATQLALPNMAGKLDGVSLRVPTPDGSLTDFVALMAEEVSVAEVNAAFKKASESSLAGIMQYSEDDLVSTDIVGLPYSCIFDSKLTMCQGRLVKVFGWYDNEWGYVNRLLDLAIFAGKQLG